METSINICYNPCMGATLEGTFMLTTELFIAISSLCFGCLGFGFTIGYAFGKISNKNIR